MQSSILLFFDPTFNSLGQGKDEVLSESNSTLKGKREMMDAGCMLNSDCLMDKRLKYSHVDSYLQRSSSNIVSYLSDLYGTDYEIKGKTLLRSTGTVGNQMLHLDAVPNCTCISKQTKAL